MLFTDGSQFTREGMVKLHNLYKWANENPCSTLLHGHQRRFAPHFAGPVHAVLTKTFGNRWIGRGGPVNWPARSLDLSPLDFFVWGYMKNQVYSSPVDSEMELIQRIHAAATRIQNTPCIFQQTQDSPLRRLMVLILKIYCNLKIKIVKNK